MSANEIALFAVAFLAFAASPGPDNVAIMARAAESGAWSGAAYGADVTTGILGGLVVSAFGLGMAAQSLGWWWPVLRILGAAYLVWTGIALWRHADQPMTARAPALAQSSWRAFGAGMVMNATNPKMPIFYLAVLPPSLAAGGHGEALLILAPIIILAEVLVVGVLVALARIARGAAHRQVAKFNRAAAGFLIAAG